MNAYPPAVRRFGFAAMEARAGRTARSLQARPRTVVRLWLPTTALFLLLAPFALLASPLFYPFAWRFGVNPTAAALALGRLLLSLGGTSIDVDTPDALVRIKLY
ncbi:MAG: hypothetical protein ABI655_07605 [Phenylobacterium sp.]